MNAAQFVTACTRGGYASRAEAEQYVAEHPKPTYDTDDFIAVYHAKPDPLVMHGRAILDGGYTTKRHPKGNSGRKEQDE